MKACAEVERGGQGAGIGRGSIRRGGAAVGGGDDWGASGAAAGGVSVDQELGDSENPLLACRFSFGGGNLVFIELR